MNNKNIDIFELTKKSTEISNGNFFIDDEKQINSSKQIEHRRRLNDYDFNILKDGAYKEINDDALKLEYKIAKTEDEIQLIESQIDAAKEIKDFVQVQQLQCKLISIKKDYEAMLALYNENTLSAKITGAVSDIFESRFIKNVQLLNKCFCKLYDAVVSILPSRIASVIRLRQSLNTLENINKSVDKLVTMRIPYGENIDKYQELSKYIIKANSIHAEISGFIAKK